MKILPLGFGEFFGGVGVEEGEAGWVVPADGVGGDGEDVQVVVEADETSAAARQRLLHCFQTPYPAIHRMHRLVILFPKRDDHIRVRSQTQLVLEQRLVEEGHIAGHDEHMGVRGRTQSRQHPW